MVSTWFARKEASMVFQTQEHGTHDKRREALRTLYRKEWGGHQDYRGRGGDHRVDAHRFHRAYEREFPAGNRRHDDPPRPPKDALDVLLGKGPSEENDNGATDGETKGGGGEGGGEDVASTAALRRSPKQGPSTVTSENFEHVRKNLRSFPICQRLRENKNEYHPDNIVTMTCGTVQELIDLTQLHMQVCGGVLTTVDATTNDFDRQSFTLRCSNNSNCCSAYANGKVFPFSPRIVFESGFECSLIAYRFVHAAYTNKQFMKPFRAFLLTYVGKERARWCGVRE
jgi:hypothetical protein